MKTSEAPEKVYLLPRQGGNYAPYWRTDSQDGFGIEYTRTDAFIEKAVNFLKEWDAYRVCLEGHKDWFIEQFKKYMKGE